MADLADEDVKAAVIALWATDPKLPGLVGALPETGQLKSPQPAYYAEGG